MIHAGISPSIDAGILITKSSQFTKDKSTRLIQDHPRTSTVEAGFLTLAWIKGIHILFLPGLYSLNDVEEKA
jgi:hypothetical protein